MWVLIGVGGGVAVLLLVLATVRWLATRSLEDDSLDGEEAVVDRLELLPEGHRPPPGLSPLSPSERFLAEESSRGMRALQEYLARAA